MSFSIREIIPSLSVKGIMRKLTQESGICVSSAVRSYQMIRRWLVSRFKAAAVLAVFVPGGNSAIAQTSTDPSKSPQRCASRLSIAFWGVAPDGPLASSNTPQTLADQLTADPRFHERFASFVNSEFNHAPGGNTAEDAVYHLAKHVLQNNLPWKDVFVGPYQVVATGNGAAMRAAVQNDPNGLGYFRSTAWLERYAGNEEQGIKLNTAYRMLNNVLGLQLTATTNLPGADVTAGGRQAPACRGCHYDGWYALDNTAAVLSRVVRTGQRITFTPPDGQPKMVLGGVMVKDDKELITAMVESEQFAFNTCRLVFRYLYGRVENACEADVFDQCIDAFKASGMIQSALSTVAKDPSFCQ